MALLVLSVQPFFLLEKKSVFCYYFAKYSKRVFNQGLSHEPAFFAQSNASKLSICLFLLRFSSYFSFLHYFHYYYYLIPFSFFKNEMLILL